MLKRVLTVAHVRPSTAGAEVMFCESARIHALSPRLPHYGRVLAALQQAEHAQRVVTVWFEDLDSDQIVDVES